MTRKLKVAEVERLNLTPKLGTQFPDGTFIEGWETSDISTYKGNNKYAMPVDDTWYFPIISNDTNHKLNCLLRDSKQTAKRQGVPHNLTKEYLISIIPEDNMCPILKVPFYFKRGAAASYVYPHAMSLDRIVPSLGYVEGNVMWISHRANTIKGEATAKEVCLVGLYMAERDKNFNEGEKNDGISA